ncbi:GGDEF domain-containing protein, partial [Kineococcus indalonis]|uniref:GGDEF domain-containing protein n=1 Tax=Kineococcus indalonis TaxID=2696566 RepID=UPI001411DB4E
RWAHADRLTTLVGLAALLGAGVPFAARWALGRLRTATYGVASVLWGAGVTAAGLWPHAALGSLDLRPVALTAALAGMLGMGVQHVLAARAGSDDPPLLVDALMLGSALAVAGWEALSRAGLHGGDAWHAGTVVLLLVATTHLGITVALAVEHARLRRAALLAGLMTTATAVAGVHPDPHVQHAALALALLAGLAAAVGAPAAPPQHAGRAASRAARRMEIASLVPGPVLFADIALMVVWPRLDPVLFGLYLWVLLTFTVRHATTARAVDRSTARLTTQALHDDLTGLANRAALHRALNGPDGRQCLVLLELAGLDDVNDVLGVSTGDALIRAAADEVRRVAGPAGATAYRPAGGEVAVLVPGDVATAVRLAGDLVAAVAAAPARVD